MQFVISACASFLVIHFLAAIGAIQNACQWVRLSVQFVNSAFRSPQPLNDIPCFLVNDSGVAIFENNHIVGGGLPLLGFVTVRSCFVEDFPALVFFLFQNDNDSSRRPFRGVCVVCAPAHFRADRLPMRVRGQHAISGQSVRDLLQVFTRDNALKYPLDDRRGLLVNKPERTVGWIY